MTKNFPPEYRNPGYQPKVLGKLDSGYVVYLDGRTTSGFLSTVTYTNFLVPERVKRYQIATTRYLTTVRGGGEASDAEVLQAISEIEKLRPAIQEAQSIGKDIQKVIDVPPPFDFRKPALHVVNDTAPADIYLRRAADLAIRTDSQPREQASRDVREARSKLDDLQKLVELPYAQQFAALDQQAQVTGKKAAREFVRALNRSNSENGEYRSGGDCSCAGGHACFGPRGGRYCITSGGHKRYGI
ncbi:TPA: hypothetical protein ACP32N_003241 [Pseudomonas aeruginosa]